jgi:hypothetical protein
MSAKARTTRNPALPRPARWRAAKAREAMGVPALPDFEPGPAEATGRTAVLQGVRRLPARLARPITGRVTAMRRRPDLRETPDAKGARWVRRFPTPVPRSRRADDRAERPSDPGPRGAGIDEAGRGGPAPRDTDQAYRDGRDDPRAGERSRGRSRIRLGRKPRDARPDDWIPVRFRVARAVGAAASALPESRAVRVGTVVVDLVAANQGAIKAGLTAASAVPVLRPYVKVAATAMGAIAVARRVARAKNAAADVAAAFRGPGTPGTAHAGNGFGLDPQVLPAPPASGREPDAVRGTPAPPAVPAQTNSGTSPTVAGTASAAAADRAPQTNDPEEVDPSAALEPEHGRDAGAPAAGRAAGATNTERGREP